VRRFLFTGCLTYTIQDIHISEMQPVQVLCQFRKVHFNCYALNQWERIAKGNSPCTHIFIGWVHDTFAHVTADVTTLAATPCVDSHTPRCSQPACMQPPSVRLMHGWIMNVHVVRQHCASWRLVVHAFVLIWCWTAGPHEAYFVYIVHRIQSN
jgi:hypothetical protein